MMRRVNGGRDKGGRWQLCGEQTAVLLTVCLLGFFLLFLPSARAQTIRAHGSGYGLSVREANTAAEKAGRTDWPTLRIEGGTTGTQVHIAFNARNADVTFVTLAEYPQDTLLATAQAFARDTGFARADYITYDNTRTSVVDVELNKYLRPLQSGKNGAEIDLPLGKFAQRLAKTDLPKPVVFYISGDGADEAQLKNSNGQTQPIGDATFLSVDDVLQAHDAQTLRFRSEISPLAYVVAVGFVLMFAFMLTSMARLPWVAAKTRREAARKAVAEPAVPDPAEVQRKYNAQKPAWQIMVITFLPFLLVPFVVLGSRGKGVSHVLTSGFALLTPLLPDSPFALFAFLPFGVFAVTGVSWAVCKLVERRREAQTGVPSPTVSDANEVNFPRIVGPFLAIAATITAPLLIILLPESTRQAIGPVGLKLLLGGSPLLGFAVAAFLCFRNWKINRTEVFFGNPWHDLVLEVAQKAGGVTVKHVVLTQASAPNAAVSLFGTVALTHGLVTKMEPDDVRVVVAHEIAHIKSGHVKKSFAVGLTILAAYLALYFLILLPQKSHFSSAAWAMICSPIPGTILGNLLVPLVTGFGRRKRELEADRLATQIIGDPEAVIHTLRKLHTLSATPHHLKPSDELLSSHPSLAHRIDALRQMQPGP